MITLFKFIIFRESSIFASNSFIVSLLGKMEVLLKVPFASTIPKQVVLVVKVWHFTMKERPSTIPKQLVLVSKVPSLPFYMPIRQPACGTYNPSQTTCVPIPCLYSCGW